MYTERPPRFFLKSLTNAKKAIKIGLLANDNTVAHANFLGVVSSGANICRTETRPTRPFATALDEASVQFYIFLYNANFFGTLEIFLDHANKLTAIMSSGSNKATTATDEADHFNRFFHSVSTSHFDTLLSRSFP